LKCARKGRGGSKRGDFDTSGRSGDELKPTAAAAAAVEAGAAAARPTHLPHDASYSIETFGTSIQCDITQSEHKSRFQKTFAWFQSG
jgi:hypothetical protein